LIFDIKEYNHYFNFEKSDFNFKDINWRESTLAIVYSYKEKRFWFEMGVINKNKMGWLPTNVFFIDEELNGGIRIFPS